jgi:enterochelin esterase family protein
LDYKLVVDNNWILDPLNPHHTSGGFGPNSELAMPAYVQPPEIQNYAIPHGEITYHTFNDTTQGRTRPVRIYTPPGYTENTLRFRTVYFHDGNEYLNLGFAGRILDYLIANQEIPPLIGVFVDPTNRNEEYSYDLEFMEMFVRELVPWVDTEYRTMAAPESRAVTGVSLGGLTALLFTIQHPEVFGNCGAYSPAIWFGDLIDQYQDSSVLPVRIYMDAGTYEPSIYNSASELQVILAGHGWDQNWQIWHEGHSWGAWRAHLDESLRYFWPLASTGIDHGY